MLDYLRQQKDITALQGYVITSLNREVLAGYGHWKGKTAAAIISNAIEVWRRLHPIDIDEIYNMLVNVHIETELDGYEPTTEDKNSFEAQYLAQLKVLYDDYLAERMLLVEETLPPSKPKETVAVTVDIKSKVEVFERTIAASSSSLYKYMLAIARPLVFLSGPLAKYAKFFNAKVKAGKFDVEKLGEANLAHLLPELAMNQSITDDQWKKIFSAIDYLVEMEATKILDLYSSLLDPTARIPAIIGHPNINIILAPIVKHLKDPRDVCEGGSRPVVRKGKYVYRKGTKEKLMEPIPLEDIVICYSGDKFTCHDTSQLVRSLSAGDHTNPYTKQPYPKSFVDKVMSMYTSSPEPGEPDLEEEEEAEVEVKKVETVPKKKLPALKATKKKTGKYTKKIFLAGDPFEIYLLFETVVELTASDGSVRTIDIVKSARDAPDVSVVGYDHKPTTSELKSLSKVSGDLYIVIADNVEFKAQSSMTKDLKSKNKAIKEVYYIPRFTEDDYDMLAAVQKAINDFEGGIQKQM